ncbi:uncharacterized protein K02A2.6-like [Ochlerotatus camptorhynchus]|uniref:uncharacterized protein K02A2.6-like n=1 Tax=Ochlerotatus camptorhynchus TaxID=644619 RepID=UPI0031D03C42
MYHLVRSIKSVLSQQSTYTRVYYSGYEDVHLSKMAASAANFRKFEEEEEEWQLFKEQLEEWFKSAGLEAGKKVPILINCLSVKTYKLVRDLCTPAVPAEKTYAELCQLLASHFTPTTVVHRERRMFFAAKQGEQGPENVNMWIARIKRLSANCKFGNHLEHNLTNKFITGLSGRALDRVCEEDENVTFEKARELALKYEQEEDRKSVEAEHVNIVRQRMDRTKHEESRRRSQVKPSSEEVECYVCGRRGHVRANCRFRNSVCNSCSKRGHLAAVCRTRTKHYVEDQEAFPDHDVSDECIESQQNFMSKPVVFRIKKIENIPDKPIKVGVTIDKKNLVMELDSGAATSAVSEKFHRKFLRCYQLSNANLKLLTYNGQRLKVLGCIEPVVTYNGEQKKVNFAVIGDGGPPLLGRNFMREFKLQLLPLKRISEDRSEQLEHVLNRFKHMFSGKLGKYTGAKIDLEVQVDAKPVFCKPRPVPLSLEPMVDQEIETMETSGVISRCDSSVWATPVVPVLKDDGNRIRLCGDYKVTLNKVLKYVRHPLPRVEEKSLCRSSSKQSIEVPGTPMQ